MPNDKKERATGSQRMKELGYTGSTVWLDAKEYQAIKEAQRDKAAVMPMATLLRKLACDFAGIPFVYR